MPRDLDVRKQELNEYKKDAFQEGMAHLLLALVGSYFLFFNQIYLYYFFFGFLYFSVYTPLFTKPYIRTSISPFWAIWYSNTMVIIMVICAILSVNTVELKDRWDGYIQIYKEYVK